MSVKDAQFKLADAYRLLIFSQQLIEGLDDVKLAELPRTMQLVHKNIRDAKKLISEAEATLDDMVKEIDEEEALAVLREDEEFAGGA